MMLKEALKATFRGNRQLGCGQHFKEAESVCFAGGGVCVRRTHGRSAVIHRLADAAGDSVQNPHSIVAHVEG